MTLEQAVEAHLGANLFMSRLGDAKELVTVGPVRVMRDAPGRKRDPRKEQFIIYGVQPAEALKAIKSYGSKFWGLSVIDTMEDDHDQIKTEYKAAGYRSLIRFPFFGFDLSQKVRASKDIVVERVTTVAKAELLRAANGRGILPTSMMREGDAQLRVYASFLGLSPAGWVQSVRANADSSWVSGLFVQNEFRQKGIGSAIMMSMLIDDAKYGAKNSYLLASNEGSNLYRRLGYKELGLMQIFSPIRS